MRILLFVLFWFVYFPLMRLLVLLLFWNNKVEERERFEKKNKFEALAFSFAEIKEKADLCFEFSSEGEFQQVAPLIDDALKARKKIELVFFSPSVERAVMRLAAQYPKQIRYLRYPFLRLFPCIRRRSFTHWVTSSTLIMVRYDLFPEFLLWGMGRDKKLKIVWVSFKKERVRGKTPSFWKKLFLTHASELVYAGVPDQALGERLGNKGEYFDFRIEQIRRRITLREEKFNTQFPLYPEFRKDLSRHPKTLILGNIWPSDLFLLRDLPKDVFLVLVPHKLSPEILNLIRKGIDLQGREVFEIDNRTTEYRPSSTVLINKKGILCELYTDFTHAYVGGGFEGSIHSVLEPLIAGRASIACGPFHDRSTEYDIAFDWQRISEVNTPEQFMVWLNSEGVPGDRDKMSEVLKNYEEMRKMVISC